jgi:hypothetical protein
MTDVELASRPAGDACDMRGDIQLPEPIEWQGPGEAVELPATTETAFVDDPAQRLQAARDRRGEHHVGPSGEHLQLPTGWE